MAGMKINVNNPDGAPAVGSTVQAKTADHTYKGILKFVGPVQFAKGTWAGIF
ncbi:hypothetical protein BC833DRAFT_593924 [Globomyces pollinis-pini]|nr:hypothetical protein BC833DRAFT_593924 [Globomyces pollinis-pini]